MAWVKLGDLVVNSSMVEAHGAGTLKFVSQRMFVVRVNKLNPQTDVNSVDVVNAKNFSVNSFVKLLRVGSTQCSTDNCHCVMG